MPVDFPGQSDTTPTSLIGWDTGATSAASAPCGTTGLAVLASANQATARTAIGAAPLASPALSGTPTAPTATVGTNTTQIATTAFVLANAGAGGAVSAKFTATSSLSGAHSGADLSNGAASPSVGDSTAALQTLLSAGGYILWDGAYSITGLTIPSNTYIYALPGCGAILAAGSTKPLFRNANPSFGVGSSFPLTVGSITDQNITIEGGIWNGNGPNLNGGSISASDGNLLVGMRWWGVKNLRLINTTIFNTGCYATHFANWQDVTILNDRIDQSLRSPSNYSVDGHHFNGPGQFLRINGSRISSYDDAIALNADDGASVLSDPFFPKSGAITDVHISNVTFDNSRLGFRLLSSSARLDRVSISGVRGSTTSVWLLMNTFRSLTSFPSGVGNFGEIDISDVDVSITSIDTAQGEYNKGMAYVSGQVDRLSIRGLRVTTPPTNATPPIYLGAVVDSSYSPQSVAQIKRLEVLDFDYRDDGTNGVAFISNAGALVDSMEVRGRIKRASGSGANMPVLLNNPYTSTGGVNRLLGRVDAYGVANIVKHQAGTMTSVLLEGVHDNAGAGNGSFAISTGLTTLNYLHSNLIAVLANSGAGTITNNLGGGGGGGGTGPTVYNLSTFAGSGQSGALASFTPTTGPVWTDASSGWTVATTSGGYATGATGSVMTYVDAGTGHANCTITATFTPLSLTDQLGVAGIQFSVRISDLNNFIAVNIQTDIINIYDVVAGVATQIGTAPITSALANGTPYVMTITLAGTAVSASVNGTTANGTTTHYTTPTLNGMLVFGGAGMKVASYQVTS